MGLFKMHAYICTAIIKYEIFQPQEEFPGY